MFNVNDGCVKYVSIYQNIFSCKVTVAFDSSILSFCILLLLLFLSLLS